MSRTNGIKKSPAEIEEWLDKLDRELWASKLVLNFLYYNSAVTIPKLLNDLADEVHPIELRKAIVELHTFGFIVEDRRLRHIRLKPKGVAAYIEIEGGKDV